MRVLIGLFRGLFRLACCIGHLLAGLWLVRRLPGRSPPERLQMIRHWSAGLLRRLGLRLSMVGTVPQGPCLIVANHVSWLDIAAIHACWPQARFISKADVRHWPLIGWMVAAAGTLFIERESKRDALRVVHHMAEALRAGDVLAVFPEGTTSEGHSLLNFHANLLQAAIAVAVPVQPVLLRYADPAHRVSPAVAYIGDTTLLGSLWRIACARGLSVQIEALPQIVPLAGMERRDLAQQARGAITAALEASIRFNDNDGGDPRCSTSSSPRPPAT
jgi:1-acyl-sn-glycerol-3-phosphate acyltransferase